MSVFMPLPADLKPWQRLSDALLSEDDEAIFNTRLEMFEKRVTEHRPPMSDLPIIGREVFEQLLHTIRPLKHFPVRPEIGAPRVSVKLEIADIPKPITKAFTWRWYWCPLPEHLCSRHEHDQRASVAVAKVGDGARIDNSYQHFISISSIWKLMPMKEGLGPRLNPQAPLWKVMEMLQVGDAHFVRSNRSMAAREAPNDEGRDGEHAGVVVGMESDLRFPMYMGTVLFLVAFLSTVVEVPNQKEIVQMYTYKLYGDLCAALPEEFNVNLPGQLSCAVVRHRFEACVVQRLLVSLGIDTKWGHDKITIGMERTGSVPLCMLLWFLARWSRFTPTVSRSLGALMHQLCRRIDRAWRSCLLDKPRRTYESLESESVIKQAAVGSDKALLLFNTILGKRQGSNLENEVLLSQLTKWKNPSWCQWAGTLALVSTYYTKAMGVVGDVLRNWAEPCVGFRMSFDDSRVSSLEVMTSHLYVGDVMLCGPVQIKPDQSAVLAEDNAFASIDLHVGGGAGGRRTRSTKDGAATLSTLYAICNALFAMLPFRSLEHFKPSSSDNPSSFTTRWWSAKEQRHYNWDRNTKKSSWCMADELLSGGSASIFILVLVGDEGSTGTAVFFYLVGFASLRCIFWRDPAHRLANLFIRSLRGVPGLLTRVSDHLLLHKFRRAPFGNGTMLKEAKETVALLLSRLGRVKQLVSWYSCSIARDGGVPDTADNVVEKLKEFTRMAMGGKVEMRRWMTYMDMGPHLDNIWHTLLLALVAECMIEGKDPYTWLAEESAKMAEDDGDAKTFHYKVEALRILSDSVSQGVLRIVLTLFQRTRHHHGLTIAQCGQPGASLEFILFWAHESKVITTIIMPTIADAFTSGAPLAYIGIDQDVPPFSGRAVPNKADFTEPQELVFTFLRLLIQIVWEWWVFVILPRSPPWCYARMLSSDVSEKRRSMSYMKRVYELILRLEGSKHPKAQEFLTILFFRTWPVVREPLQLYEQAKWDIYATRPLNYIKELVSQFTHSLMEEHAFEALRDNEQRGARHHQRGENKLTALTIASARDRYPEMTGIEISPEDVTSFTTLQVRKAVFHPESLHRERADLGVDTAPLTGARRAWPTTTMDLMALNQMCLLKALLLSVEEEWGAIWLACLVAKHAIVAHTSTCKYYYVLGVTKWLLYAWELDNVVGNDYRLRLAPDAFHEIVVTSVDDLLVYEYDISFTASHDVAAVNFTIGAVMTLLRSSVRYTLVKLTNAQIQAIMKMTGTPRASNKTKLGLITQLLEHMELDQTEDGKQLLSDVKEAAVKRTKKKSSKAGASDEADDDEGESSGDSDVEVRPPVSKLLSKIAPLETDYVLGKVLNSRGLGEEEDDDFNELRPDAKKSRFPKPDGATQSKAKLASVPSGHTAKLSSLVAPSATESVCPTILDDPVGACSGDDAPIQPSSASAASAASAILSVAGLAASDGVPPAEAAASSHGVDAIVARVEAMTRASAIRGLSDELPAPNGCAFREYSYTDPMLFEAKLPKGMTWGLPPRNSRSRVYGKYRTRDAAYNDCKAWLESAGIGLHLY